MVARQGREVLFEMVRIGDAVKVTAIDAATGTEASVVASPRYSPEHLKMLASRKLDTKLRGQTDPDTTKPPPRGGILA